FATAADGVLVVRLAADTPGSIDTTLRLTSEQDGAPDPAGPDSIGWRGRNRGAEGIAGRLRLAVRACVRATGGSLRPAGTSLRVEGASEVVILLDAATSF